LKTTRIPGKALRWLVFGGLAANAESLQAIAGQPALDKTDLDRDFERIQALRAKLPNRPPGVGLVAMVA
jgi:hypothetical protein